MDGTLILTREDIASLLSAEDCIRAVEAAFRKHGEGTAPAPQVLGVHAGNGGFHIKAAMLTSWRPFFAAKLNGNFPQNPERVGLPTIQGVVVLCDATNGCPLAILDSIEITRLRTAAATAIAARYLARRDSRVLAIFGCGMQAAAQVRALRTVLPLERVHCYDLNPARAMGLAQEITRDFDIAASTASEVGAAAASADVMVTCTPSTHWFIGREHVRPGMFIAAVGADGERKQELEPELLKSVKLVVDSLPQCSTLGDLHHAVEGKIVTTAEIHGELGDVVAGLKPGRTSDEEITVFDSTGVALQDVAAAAAVYERAHALTTVTKVDFACRH